MFLKNLQEVRIKPIIQFCKHCYRRNKLEAGESSALRWTISFINANS